MSEHDSTRGPADEEDAALRARLRRVDPAHDLPPRAPHWITWKVEDTVTNDQHAPRTTGTAPAGRRRTGLIAGLTGAAAAAAATVTVVALALGSSAAGTTSLTASGGGAASGACAVITAADLAQQQLAFEARVTGIDDATVTLEVLHRYRGEVEDEVTVTQPSGETIEFAPDEFSEGGDYLLSADDGRLSVCGQTGPVSPELRALYEQAFPG